MKTKQAIAEVRKWANTIKAFEKITEVADQLEQAEQILKESSRALIVMNEQVDLAGGTLEGMGADMLIRRDQLKDMEATAQAERDTIISRANGRASDIVGEARANLDRYTEEGQSAVIELREVRTEITKREADLAALTAKLEKAHRQARRILGGGA